jgi:site-specific DNA-cytosine methylase
VSGAGNLYVGAFQPVVAGSHDRGRPLKAIEGPSPTIGASYGDKGRSPWTSAGAPFLIYTEGRAGTEPGRLGQPAPTVATTEEKGTRASEASGWTFNGGPDRASDAAFLAVGRRRLTWQECAALQDFPPDYPFQGTIGARYRQVGNAVPPKLAEVVGRAVQAAGEGGQDDD